MLQQPIRLSSNLQVAEECPWKPVARRICARSMSRDREATRLWAVANGLHRAAVGVTGIGSWGICDMTSDLSH